MTPSSSDTTVGRDSREWRHEILEEVVPWPDNNNYIILEKSTRRAITLAEGRLHLQDVKKDKKANNRWKCIEKDGYFGFYNSASRVYMGHDGKAKMIASAASPRDWELMSPRRHPDGGHQLLYPYYGHTLLVINTVDDGRRLERTRHGDALWEFVQV